MAKHVIKEESYKGKPQITLGYIAQKPNVYTGSMESVKVTFIEGEKSDSLDLRKFVESEQFTGLTKQGIRLERHHLIEFLAILPEIKKRMEIEDDDTDVLDAIEERQKALAKPAKAEEDSS